jgi:predicted ribosome quality control (RQC) complex YloA/Tae2 family protein
MNTEARKNDDRISVDNLSSLCSNERVIRTAQVAKALSQQAKVDFDRLKAIESEQTKLRKEYLQFLDLEEEKKNRSARLRRTAALIPSNLQSIGASDDDEEEEDFRTYVVHVNDLTLWEAMLAVLEHTGEIQLYELQHVLEQLGKKVTRGAIESAITTHAGNFHAKTRGRERFVSLKR